MRMRIRPGASVLRRLVLGILVIVPIAGGGSRTLAQTGPEGNAHPESRMVSDAPDTPFGVPDFVLKEQSVPERSEAARRKHEFASKLELGALRELAVNHNGRVKPIDTLARDTIRAIAGRNDYVDFVQRDGEMKKVRYDPVFTLLDLVIDPAYYVDRPLIFVNYLPLRGALIDLAVPDDAAQRERWMKLTRVSPRMVAAHADEVANRYDSIQPYNEGLGEISRALMLWEESGRNFLVIPPGSTDLAWHHLSEGGDAIKAAGESLGQAWRAHDAEGVNKAAAELAGLVRALGPGSYPSDRMALEVTHNRAGAFNWGMWLYALAFISLILAFGTGRKALAWGGTTLLIAAIGMHSFGFVTRCVLAERFAIQNQFESMTGVSLFAALVGTTLMVARRQWLFGAASAGVGFLVLIAASQDVIPGRSIEREAAILSTSVLLKYHVTTVLTSYGLIALGMVVSVMYLIAHYARPRVAVASGTAHSGGSQSAGGMSVAFAGAALDPELSTENAGPSRTLSDLDKAQLTILQLAFWTLGVGILLGAWWADHSWGRWWGWDPKETFALVTWIIYLIVIHLRFTMTGPKRGLTTAWLSLVGFIAMVWCYFGVNLMLSGLHAYA